MDTMWQIFIYLSCSASRGTPDKGQDVLWGRLLLRLIYAPRLGEVQHSVVWKYRGFRGQVPAQTPMIVWSHWCPHSWYILHRMEAARLALCLLPSRNTGCEGVGAPWPMVNMRLWRLRWGLSLQPSVAVPTWWRRPPTFKSPANLLR